jgi:hypothetical protein
MELKVCFLGAARRRTFYLLPQGHNFSLERCPRPKQICDHPNNEPDKISHPQQHRPILEQLLVRLGLRQGQLLASLKRLIDRPLCAPTAVPSG